VEWLAFILQPVQWIFDRLLNLSVGDDDSHTPEVEKLLSTAATVLQYNDQDLTVKIAEVDTFLDDLKSEAQHLASISKGAMRGDLYFNGAALLEIGEAMSRRLQGQDDLSQQHFKATSLWVGLVLNIAAHYHHLIGPAMIAMANAGEKIGDTEHTIKACRTVVSDFELILEREEHMEYRPVQENLVSIECLDAAVQKLIFHQVQEHDDLLTLKQRIDIVLNKEQDPNILEGPVEVVVKSNGRIKCPSCNWSLVYSEDDMHCRSCGIEHIFTYE
jgi:hypothetical protein